MSWYYDDDDAMREDNIAESVDSRSINHRDR